MNSNTKTDDQPSLVKNAALKFHDWMLRKGWALHSSKQYYYRSEYVDKWPPDETGGINEVYEKFLQDHPEFSAKEQQPSAPVKSKPPQYEVREARNGDLCIMLPRLNVRIATFSKGTNADAEIINKLLQDSKEKDGWISVEDAPKDIKQPHS